VVEQFASEGAAQSLGEGVLPRRARCGENLGGAHTRHPLPKLGPEDAGVAAAFAPSAPSKISVTIVRCMVVPLSMARSDNGETQRHLELVPTTDAQRMLEANPS